MADPTTFEQAASVLARASAGGRSVRVRGGGTKLGWGTPAPDPAIELRTGRLNRIVEHNAGDLTAVLEAGVPLVQAQQTFAEAGQMLALDPPLGRLARNGGEPEERATIGGVLATADSGPLRHRYGAPRDLVLGVTVALSDGTIARSGSKVIKNVAGYDIAKLFAGSFGTLGAILSVNVRLHPQPLSAVTAVGSSSDTVALGAGAVALAVAPLELEALDVFWQRGRGELLARSGGAEAPRRAVRVARRLADAGLDGIEVVADDESLWARQRAGQRSADGALVRVAARPSALAGVLGACERCAGTLVGRAALGISYVKIDPGAVSRFVDALPVGARMTVLDAPDDLRRALDPWGPVDQASLELMRRIKHRFDPGGICNPGVFAGGI